jgi:hypothetical protein
MDEGPGGPEGGYCLGSATLRTSEMDGKDCCDGESLSPTASLLGSEDIILEMVELTGVGYPDERGGG